MTNQRSRSAARKLLPLLLLLLAAPAPAAAQAEGNPPNWCRNGAFPSDSESFRLGRVKGRRNERVYFHKDDDGCPSPRAQCRERAYVVHGDEVIVSRTFGDWACAWYQPARGSERVGWIMSHQLDIDEGASAPSPARLVGHWTYYDNFISIRPGPQPGRFNVDGEAYWRGVGGNIHTGNIAGEVASGGGGFTYEDDPCRAKVHLVGPYLVVSDNKQCGGFNVSFDGVYRKKPPRRKSRRD